MSASTASVTSSGGKELAFVNKVLLFDLPLTDFGPEIPDIPPPLRQFY